MKKLEVSWIEVESKINELARDYQPLHLDFVLGVSRGGIIPGVLLARKLHCRYKTVEPFADDWGEFRGCAVLVIDDILDSGATLRFIRTKLDDVRVDTLFTKTEEEKKNGIWYTFPWATMQDTPGGREQAVVALLRSIGEDPLRPGLKGTPERIARMYDELFIGYKMNPDEILSARFPCEQYDEMIVSKDIEFFSMCEHHLLPFQGLAHVAYIPDKAVVGLSKLSRVVDCFSKRLQLQERMTVEIGKAIESALKPKGVGVVVEASHLCMELRGVKKRGSKMITSYLGGDFRADPKTRQEFMTLIGK